MMYFQRTPVARAVLSILATIPSFALAQNPEQTLPAVVVTATPFGSSEDRQILAPAKVLAGNELRDKLGVSLGETLSNELGVSASAFGAGASRPIIRGLEGPRVKILQNGMSSADVSSLSNDHAVAVDSSTARQIEILRGPAALLYGSGAIGGLVNVVNERIPTLLLPKPTGEAEVRYSTVDKGNSVSAAADGAVGKIGLHIDASYRDTEDYKIPGFAAPGDSDSAFGRLPNSYTRQHNLGFGASLIENWGHIGASVGFLKDQYGIPTEERSFIDLSKNRFDVDGLLKQPLEGFSSLRVKLGVTDYEHTEKEQDGTPATDFKNQATEARFELDHLPIAGWRGTFGMHSEHSKYSALSAETGTPDTVPVTKSTSLAAFLVEERDFGPVRANAGLRVESVKRRPEGDRADQERDFNLYSSSVGGLWSFRPGYGLGTTFSIAQRAPTTEELYSEGPHESTATFDIGNPDQRKETSRNIELTLQKTAGLVRWRTNLFQNQVENFIYGQIGETDPNEEFRQREWVQADATIRGAEAEISYNLRGEGLSLRGFADTSRGKLDGMGNLPLQPATRYGIDAGFRQGAWRTGLSVLRAQSQDRLASFETSATPAYTLLNAQLSYTQRYGTNRITWFALAKNLLDEDIRVSTSLLKDVAPQPGRNFIVGARVQF